MANPPGKDRYEADLAEAVMEYLAQHPLAMDTAAGIAEWWLPSMRATADLVAMRKVLDQLCDRGLLERIGSGEHAHYRLKKT